MSRCKSQAEPELTLLRSGLRNANFKQGEILCGQNQVQLKCVSDLK